MNGQWLSTLTPSNIAAAAAGGGADALPSSEALEVEAIKRGMPPLEQCLRRCPRCLQGVPIRSMMCPHCQYLIPVSAKAMARREMKEAALQGQGVTINGAQAGYSTAATPAAVAAGAAAAAAASPGYYPVLPEQIAEAPVAEATVAEITAAEVTGVEAGGSDSDEPRRRQKRKRQSTKKGSMTATEEELAELDEGMEDEEPVSWKKSSGQRGRSGDLTSYLRYDIFLLVV